MIGARDRVRPEAAEVLAELRALGIAPVALLTGDRAAVAQAVAEQVPVTEVHAELLPAQKARWVGQRWPSPQAPVAAATPDGKIRALPLPGQGPGGTAVAFVGDGINDAPALARAGVGIAIGAGTDIAAEAGDIVLMGEPLRPLPLLVRLSRETVRIIRQNIVVFAFGVNLVGIVLTGWLWPLFATVAGVVREGPARRRPLPPARLAAGAAELDAAARVRAHRTDEHRGPRPRRGEGASTAGSSALSVDDLLHALGAPLEGGSRPRLRGLALLGWLATGLRAGRGRRGRRRAAVRAGRPPTSNRGCTSAGRGRSRPSPASGRTKSAPSRSASAR